jgi:hypothetical protein
VAQTIADLSGKKWPSAEDIEKAMKYSVTPFVELQRWD